MNDDTDDETDRRTDLEQVIEVRDGRKRTFHLRTWTTYKEDATLIRTWCGDEFDVDENEVWTLPMVLIDREALCIDCYYKERNSVREMFNDTIPGDE